MCEQIRNTSAMEIFEVWLAIGSIWEALRAEALKVPPYRVQNAYAGLDIFMPLQPHMEHEYINKVAGPEKQFIMPLIFPADEQLERLGTGQGKGKRKADKDRDVEYIGHLMLAVAHIELRNGGKRIKMDIYDSDPKTFLRTMTRERTKVIVENSEWAAPDDQGAHIPIANNTYLRTPKQKANSNTCGFYTILNAWAVMLGIPVHPQSRRRGQSTHGEFMAQGLEIINLALSGHMDSRTITGFPECLWVHYTTRPRKRK